jgi:uncharacterized lipoprotein YmbA
MRSRARAATAALLLATSLSACLFRARPDRTRYYTLAAVADAPVPVAGGLSVGLGPVTMPGYLGRPGLVTRLDDTRVEYAEGERWAEPLRRQFVRTLSEDLSQALGGARILDYPWRSGATIDIAVRLDVRAFETDTAGTAMLTADWSLRQPTPGTVVSQGKSVITEPAGGPGRDAAVTALSRALAQLSRELATAIAAETRRR